MPTMRVGLFISDVRRGRACDPERKLAGGVTKGGVLEPWGGKMGKFMKQKSPESTLFASNTRGLITNQTSITPSLQFPLL